MSNLFNVFVGLNLRHDVTMRGKCWLIYPDMRTLLPFVEAQYAKFRKYSDKRIVTNKRSCRNKQDYMYCIFICILFFFIGKLGTDAKMESNFHWDKNILSFMRVQGLLYGGILHHVGYIGTWGPTLYGF